MCHKLEPTIELFLLLRTTMHVPATLLSTAHGCSTNYFVVGERENKLVLSLWLGHTGDADLKESFAMTERYNVYDSLWSI